MSKVQETQPFCQGCRSGIVVSPGQSTAKQSQSRDNNIRPVNTSNLEETSSESSDSGYCYAVDATKVSHLKYHQIKN